MAQVSVRKTIHAPADAIWKTVGSFRGIDRYLPEVVASCSVEGEGAGATRTCILHTGVTLSETLESLDDEHRTLIYTIGESEMPFEAYRATVMVRAVSDGRCEVEWSATFEPRGAAKSEVIAMLEGMYAQAIGGLERLHRGA